ncbi:MAG: hypothetical protein U0Z26_01060 [Anaerolineales bacterium]
MKFRRNMIIVLVIATAILHLAAAFDKVLYPEGADPLFILNGIGFIGLLGAYYLPIPFFQQNHKLVWWALFGYTILTIIAWLVIFVGFSVIRDGMGFFSYDSIYGIPAKVFELGILYLLWQEKP